MCWAIEIEKEILIKWRIKKSKKLDKIFKEKYWLYNFYMLSLKSTYETDEKIKYELVKHLGKYVERPTY